MKFLFAFLFFVFAIMLSFSLGSREWQFAFIGLATFVGFLFGHVLNLSKQLKQLRELMDKNFESRITGAPISKEIEEPSNDDISDTQIKPETDVADQSITQNEDYLDVVNQAAANVEADPIDQSQSSQAAAWDSSWNTAEAINQEDANTVAGNTIRKSSKPSLSDKLTTAIKGYFTGGNIFVRIGIIILFFGVSFLLKYVSDRGFFPIEYRLIGVVIGAMCLLGLGWRLRHKNETYALLLQGAGIGVLYLDIYAAYNLYNLIPHVAAFALMFVVSMFCAALAVMQDSKSLAVLVLVAVSLPLY